MSRTQPPEITKILRWQEVHAGRIAYSETAPTRLDYETHDDLLSTTDCSGMVARMFAHFAGINVGTYTGNECSYGTLVTVSASAARMGYGMLPGDCILFDWDGGTWDHIAIYAGDGRIWNHGGPGNGPLDWSLADNVDNAVKIMVRRFLPWPRETVTHPPVHGDNGGEHPTPNPMHGHPIPELIARGTGDYYGLASGPNESHGGAYKSEQHAVRLIQRFLNWKMDAGIPVDGTFGRKTERAVAAFQHKYLPGTDSPGQVWFDDWHAMATADSAIHAAQPTGGHK